MKSFSQFLSESRPGAHPTDSKNVDKGTDAALSKVLPKHQQFGHGPNHKGWLHQGGKPVPVRSVHDALLKSGYRVSRGTEKDFTGNHVTSYHKTTGPFHDARVSIHSKDGNKTAWHVEHSVHHDLS